MDVLTMLERDHRKVESLLAQLSESEPGAERTALVERVTQALDLHMRFEEEHVYPLLQEIDAETTEEANIEHDLARRGVMTMTELIEQPGFAAAVEMVTAGIGHHVRDEEGEAFPMLRKQCPSERLTSLTRTLLAEKRTAGMLVDDESSKDELLEIAAQLDVNGRTSMTKDELRTAIGTAS
jgi:iron-sulfur cluster repair protein YtfE (RIC family)